LPIELVIQLGLTQWGEIMSLIFENIISLLNQTQIPGHTAGFICMQHSTRKARAQKAQL